MITMAVCFAIALILGVFLALPFLFGGADPLQAASSVESIPRLESMRHAILKRYLEEEAAFKKGVISKGVWAKRQALFVNRFIDATRRLDFLRHNTKADGGGAA